MTILTDAEVGTMLRQDRDASEMTLGEAAELAGITPGALYRIEQGYDRPDVDMFARLCNIYTMPVSEAQVVADNSLTVSQ
ncbi:MAG TPA: hypothetical protein DCP69_02880 [Candidatus Omnitrophica bacterium]|nr:hypothetical protein [Candidatus Omnitrophota bacterium]